MMMPDALHPLGRRSWRTTPPLPYDAEVEYLRTDGYEYILTNILPVPTMRIAGSFRWNTIVAQARFYSSNSDGGNEYSLYRGGSQISFRFASSATATFGNGVDGTVYNFDINSSSATVNGTTKAVSSGNRSGLYPFAIFGRNNTGTVYYSDYKMFCDFYWLKFWVGDVLVGDYIPVRVGSGANAVGCLYDKLGTGGQNPDGTARSDGLYFNRGTGAFVVGPDKN